MKKVISMMAIAAFLVAGTVNAQQKPEAKKADAKTEKKAEPKKADKKAEPKKADAKDAKKAEAKK